MNASLLHDVRDSSTDETIQVLSNGNGSVVFSQLGTLNLFPMTVYLNPSSMANILSLRNASIIPGVHVTMNTATAKCMNVHVPSGLTYMFFEGSNGLYYLDITYPDKHIKNNVTAYSFTSTVVFYSTTS